MFVKVNTITGKERKICNLVCENLPVIKEPKVPANIPTLTEIKMPVRNDAGDI